MQAFNILIENPSLPYYYSLASWKSETTLYKSIALDLQKITWKRVIDNKFRPIYYQLLWEWTFENHIINNDSRANFSYSYSNIPENYPLIINWLKEQQLRILSKASLHITWNDVLLLWPNIETPALSRLSLITT